MLCYACESSDRFDFETPAVPPHMFRIMPPERTPCAKLAEKKAIVIALNEFLSYKKIQPCVPKLAYGVRKLQQDQWSVPGLRDELVAFIQQSIHSHRSTTGWREALCFSRTFPGTLLT